MIKKIWRFPRNSKKERNDCKDKKRRLTIPLGQIIAHPKTNSDDEDDPVINIVLLDEDEISANEYFIELNPGTSRSTQNNILSNDVENKLLNETKYLNTSDYILFRYLYNAETKKEHLKFSADLLLIPCDIIHFFCTYIFCYLYIEYRYLLW